jgi:hypothetical protein
VGEGVGVDVFGWLCFWICALSFVCICCSPSSHDLQTLTYSLIYSCSPPLSLLSSPLSILSPSHPILPSTPQNKTHHTHTHTHTHHTHHIHTHTTHTHHIHTHTTHTHHIHTHTTHTPHNTHRTDRCCRPLCSRILL